MCNANPLRITDILSNISINIEKNENYTNYPTDGRAKSYSITVTNKSNMIPPVSLDKFNVKYNILSYANMQDYNDLNILYALIEIDIRTYGINNIKLKSIFSDDEFDVIIDTYFKDIILSKYIKNKFEFSSDYISFELSISTDGDFSMPIPSQFRYNLKYLDTQEFKFTYLLKTNDSIECIRILYGFIYNIYNYFKNIDFKEYEKFRYQESFANFIRFLLITNTLSSNGYVLNDMYENSNYSITATIRGLSKRKVDNSDECIYYLEV